MRLIGIVLAAALVTGCGWQSPCGRGGVESARMLLLATDVEAARIAHEQGLASAFAGYLADDAVFLPMNYPALYGPKDIGEFLSGGTGVQVTWTPADAEVAQSCDIGYSFGAWRVAGADADGNPVSTAGKYLGIWRRNAERGWRLTVYMQNMDPEGSTTE